MAPMHFRSPPSCYMHFYYYFIILNLYIVTEKHGKGNLTLIMATMVYDLVLLDFYVSNQLYILIHIAGNEL